MNGELKNTLPLIILTGVFLSQTQACSTEKIESATDSDIAMEMFNGLGPNVILPALERFSTDLEELKTLNTELESAINSSTDVENKWTETQNKWRSAISIWQEIELMQIGPAANSLKDPGGLDIRDEIYSWPTVNACRVDQRTASEDYSAPDFIESNLVNAYGLDSLEHLYFGPAETVCPTQVNPYADGSWEALGAVGVQKNRVLYASTVIDALQNHTAELISNWTDTEGNFTAQLNRSSESSPYASENEALNAIYNAIFYLETGVKDRKLATPMGLKDCDEDTCIQRMEGRTSDSSLAHLRSNLIGFKAMFTGGEGVGMEDLIADLGHGDLSEKMLADLDEALGLLDQISTTLEEAIVNDTDELNAFYEALAKVTTALKTDVVTVLNVTVPSEAAGDND